jgi:hypothetical protein
VLGVIVVKLFDADDLDAIVASILTSTRASQLSNSIAVVDAFKDTLAELQKRGGTRHMSDAAKLAAKR